MKRILLAICVIVLLGITYAYQTPVLETNQATEQAKNIKSLHRRNGVHHFEK